MVFPRPFVKIVAGGIAWDREQWVTSWSVDVGDFANNSAVSTFLEPIGDAVYSWFANPGAKIGNVAQLDYVKANLIGTDGRYQSTTETNLLEFNDSRPGGGGTQPLPPQCTVAVSLLTARTRGPGSRGRFYPPAPCVGVDQTGHMTSLHRDDMAAAAKALIDRFNAISDWRVVVASDVREGALVPVERVAVGSVVDTQRRRRSSIPEVYSTQELAPWSP